MTVIEFLSSSYWPVTFLKLNEELTLQDDKNKTTLQSRPHSYDGCLR